MFLDRLLKKRRPVVPKEESQEGLVAVVRGHADRGVRLDAVRRLVDLPLLRELLADEQDPGVREIAFGRYRTLLGGDLPDGPSPQERIHEVEVVADPRLLGHLALEAGDAEIRLAAIRRLDAQPVLVSCCLHDPRAANRAAAQERIHERASLEQVARQIGKKDKGVYRAVRERLRRMAEADEQPRRVRAQCEELCARLGQLGRLEQWSQDRALLDHLDHQWSGIADLVEPEWRERYDAMRSAFLRAYGDWREANAAQIAAREALEAERAERIALVEALGQAAALEDADAMQAERDRLLAAWETLGPVGAAGVAAIAKRLDQALRHLDAAIDRLRERSSQQERMQRAIARAERLAGQSQPLEQSAVTDLIKSGRRLAEGLGGDSAGRFADLIGQLEARIETQRKRAMQRLDALPERIDELERALESGELKRAEPQLQSLQAAIDLARSSGVGGAALHAAQGRIHRLAPRVRELRNWRRWGADQHREALCRAMEALRGEAMPLAAVAERLHVLQVDWKELDQSGAPANKGLWDRFHAASDTVYARCRPVLEAEAAERESNREAREAVCEQLEAFLDGVDWERVDWRRVMHAERETRRAWSAIGPCEVKARRRLDRRFHKAIKALDRHLEEERERNQTLKRDLIRRVEALVDAPDLNAAIEEVKGLQRQWHTTVPARQREENRLWSEMRAACDALFERRASIHQAHRAELQENLAAKEAICAEAESAVGCACDAEALEAAGEDLSRRWEDLEALPLPRESAPAISRRWRAARKALDSKAQALHAAERRVELDRLARRAAICATLERRVLDGGEALRAEAVQDLLDAWSGLPRIEDQAQRDVLQRRLDAALAAVDDPAARESLSAALEPNAGRRARLCLELEIAAGVESPPRGRPGAPASAGRPTRGSIGRG